MLQSTGLPRVEEDLAVTTTTLEERYVQRQALQ